MKVVDDLNLEVKLLKKMKMKIVVVVIYLNLSIKVKVKLLKKLQKSKRIQMETAQGRI
jgi:hypothetical protein